MIPDENYWESMRDSLDVRFLDMDIHQFIVESGFEIAPAIRKLYNPGIYNPCGYDVLGDSDVFSLSVLDEDNVKRTSEIVGAESVEIGSFASGALLIQMKGESDNLKIWDYGPDMKGRVFKEYDAVSFQRMLMPLGAKNKANQSP